MNGEKEDAPTVETTVAPNGDGSSNGAESGAAATEASELPPATADVEDPAPAPETSLETALREKDELTALLQRVQADFVNYRNRVAGERDALQRSATRRLALRVLDVVDQFDTALGTELPEGVDAAWADGFEAVRRNLLQALASEGIEPYDCDGVAFDPRDHEALLMTESADVPPNTVLNVLRKGYRMGDEVIRAAQVQISIASPEVDEQGGGEQEQD